MGTFSCAQIDLQKARERELATLDEKLTSSGIAEPYARSKFKAITGGQKERHLCPRLVQKLESKSMRKKKIYIYIYIYIYGVPCTVDPALKTHMFLFQSVFNAGNRDLSNWGCTGRLDIAASGIPNEKDMMSESYCSRRACGLACGHRGTYTAAA